MTLGGLAMIRRALGAFTATLVALALLPGTAGATASSGYRDGEDGTGMPLVRTVSNDRLTSRSLDGSVTFSDLDKTDAWAKTAIRYVAGTNDWMRDFAPLADGTYPFRPDRYESRQRLARAMVLAFAPDELPDPTILFTDIDPTSAWYRFAAVATSHRWIVPAADGSFLPDEDVTMADVHRALVLALGLQDAAKGLDELHTVRGQTFDLPRNFGTTVLGMRLFLRYNAPTGKEENDVDPRDRLTRAQVAFSLWRAKHTPSYYLDDLLTQYTNVELPGLGPKRYRLVQWGVRYGGYPYIWGGEWGFDTPEPSAFGSQPRAGFDCSGFVWWLLRANDSSAWKVAPPRPYRGWPLPQRTSRDMAAMTPSRLSYRELRPGDLMLYDGDGDKVVDHVNTYIGNGYALDSSSTPGGVTIMWVGDGWYREHFKFGRRVIS
jgi:hypothetical protein